MNVLYNDEPSDDSDSSPSTRHDARDSARLARLLNRIELDEDGRTARADGARSSSLGNYRLLATTTDAMPMHRNTTAAIGSSTSTHRNDQDFDIRAFCTGQPRQGFLRGPPPRAVRTRRSTLSDALELDDLLKAHLFVKNGATVLPLNDQVLRILGAFITGKKPIANMSIFERLAIDKKVDKVTLAELFQLIGGSVKSIVVAGGIVPEDWQRLAGMCHNLKSLKFEV